MSVFVGDCREFMKSLDESSVDACVTDPPYHLTSITERFGKPGSAPAKTKETGVYARQSKGFMGQTWDGGDVAFRPETWAEVLRVLKPGGHVLAFGGSRTYHRLACAVEDAGFEIRDSIYWLYGTGFPKSHDAGEGRGTALKPAHEPIVLARKPLIGTVAANALAYGTGAINIDATRISLNGDYKSKANGRPSQTGLDDGYNPLNANQADTVGRWPANVIHDGSDEVLEGFPHTKSGTGAVKKASGAGYSPSAFGKESRAVGTPNIEYGDEGSAARFFYCAKASKSDREDGNNHPTVKPTDLMRYLCKLITPPNGLILDPFTGSGSTGKAATLEGFRFIGAELSPEYAEIARARIAAALPEWMQ